MLRQARTRVAELQRLSTSLARLVLSLGKDVTESIDRNLEQISVLPNTLALAEGLTAQADASVMCSCAAVRSTKWSCRCG